MHMLRYRMDTVTKLMNTLIHSKDKNEVDRTFPLLMDAIKTLFDMDDKEAYHFIRRSLPKPIVATRMVPRSHPEEMGENGLMWVDYPR